MRKIEKMKTYPYIVCTLATMSILGNACFKCGSSEHKIRQCTLHLKDKNRRSENSGKWAEDVISNKCCPFCSSYLIKVEGNQPSLDFICSNPTCKSIFEVKSKCLSNYILPPDIKIHGGNYHFFSQNIRDKNLHLIVIIFKINEQTDTKIEREILFYHNNILQKALNGNNETFSIVKSEYKSLIIIPDRLKYSMGKWDTNGQLFNNVRQPVHTQYMDSQIQNPCSPRAQSSHTQYMDSRIQNPCSPRAQSVYTQYMDSRIQNPCSPRVQSVYTQYMDSRIQNPYSPIDKQSHSQYMGNQRVDPYKKLNFNFEQ